MTRDPHREAVDNRAEQPADLICEAVAEAVAEALATGQFQDYLADKGWVLVHVGDGTCPEPPGEWLHDGLDYTEPGWIDPIGRLTELWRTAWTAGYQVGQATGATQ